VGYARAKGKPVIGLRTDLRALEDRGLNLMVSQICSTLILEPGVSDLDVFVARIVDAIKAELAGIRD
jgi:nucleoside 2-deoxyribosyltransferase